jgi:hypothetical protein
MARRIASLHRTDEIPLSSRSSGGGVLSRVLRRSENSARHSGPAKLLVSASGLLIEGHPAFPERLEIPLGSIQRAVVDDGTGWAYTTATCRFPIFDRRADGSGTGALVGPLWATSPSLIPKDCPVLQLEPVPAEVPNIALIFDPCLSIAAGHASANGSAPGSIAMLILRAEDPDLAMELLGERLKTAPMGLEVLDYLNRPSWSMPEASGSEASAASA